MKKFRKVVFSILVLLTLVVCLHISKNTTYFSDDVDKIPLPFDPVPASNGNVNVVL